MAFAAGVFTRLYSWVTDRDNAVKIRADRMDAEFDGMATGLSTAILKDGTQTVTANIPMNSHKFTGLAAGTAAGDSLRYEQLVSAAGVWTNTSTDAGATAGPDFVSFRNSASPAAADIIGRWLSQGKDSAANTEDYGEIYQTIDDATSTSEDATWLIRAKVAGSMVTVAQFSGALATFSGGLTLGSALIGTTGTFSGVVKPSANDAAALGASGTAWSDAFLASGGVLNWNAGNYTLTHSAGLLTASGAMTVSGAFTSLGIDDNATAERLQIADTVLTIGSATAAATYNVEQSIDDGQLSIYGGPVSAATAGALWLYGTSHATFPGGYALVSGFDAKYRYDGAHIFKGTSLKPSANDGVSLGISGTAWSDLFLASGAVVNFAAGDYTITHSTGYLTLNGRLVIAAGSAASPAIGFGENNTGFYQSADGEIAVSSNGTVKGAWSASGFNVSAGTALIDPDGATTGVSLSTAGAMANYFTSGAGFQMGCGFASGTAINFKRVGVSVGTITWSAGATAYNTSSDKTLKQNFRPFDSGAILDALEIGQFEWISAPDVTGYGVLAQEAYGVFPTAITKPNNDDEHWSADYSKFVPLLMAEIKDLRRRLAVAGL